MIPLKNLCQFLVKAKKATYASGDESRSIKEADGSTSLIYIQGDWKYHDNYFGGEPFGGREVVFFKGKPVYMMTYYGWVSEAISNPKEIYKFLQKALSLIPEDKPYRGPKQFEEGNLRYENSFQGEVDNFSGEEIIYQDDKEIYRAKYVGGLIGNDNYENEMDKSSERKIIEAIIDYDQSLKKEWGNDPGLDEMGFSGNHKANQLLIEDPNAFVFAVIFDQGIAAERAWIAPYLLKQRLGGTLGLNVIVAAGPEKLRRLVRQKPALHRFHYLGDWIFKASELILKHYKGDASNIWDGKPSAAEVVRRFGEFVGIGQKKANMAVKILHRNLKIPLKEMHLVDIAYDIHLRRVFLRTGLVERDDAKEMIETARKLYPQSPSDLDTPCWCIGRNWCHPRNPKCLTCTLNEVCPKLTSKGRELKA